MGRYEVPLPINHKYCHFQGLLSSDLNLAQFLLAQPTVRLQSDYNDLVGEFVDQPDSRKLLIFMINS